MNEKPQKSNKKRKQISKKLRFEVFKRDSFTCQYCGAKAPDVILHIDHITPIAHGDKNILMNLVTACAACNLGKGAEKLSENSAIKKSQKQADILQQRREQIEMLRDWHMEIVQQSEIEVSAVDSLYRSLTNNEWCIAEQYKAKTIKPLLKKYGLQLVLEALSDGSRTYGDPSRALDKLPGICACKNDPDLEKRVHLLNLMNKKYWNFKRQEASAILTRGYSLGSDNFLYDAKKLVYELSGSWYRVKNEFYRLVEEYEL